MSASDGMPAACCLSVSSSSLQKPAGYNPVDACAPFEWAAGYPLTLTPLGDFAVLSADCFPSPSADDDASILCRMPSVQSEGSR